MKRPDRLATLVRLQQLRERRQRIAAHKAGLSFARHDEASILACKLEEEACSAYEALHAEQYLQLDYRELLAAGLRSATEQRLAADAARSRAELAYQTEVGELRIEAARTRELHEQAGKARRKAAIRQDDLDLRAMRSLRAALLGGMIR